MQFAQHIVMRVILTKFAKWSLEIVGLDRHIVVIGGYRTLHLVEPRVSIGIGSTMIHVVSQQIRSAAQLDQSHRIGIFRIEIRTAMISGHHAASQFTREIGIEFFALIEFLALFAELFGSNSR